MQQRNENIEIECSLNVQNCVKGEIMLVAHEFVIHDF
jgi:hypothetical protein